MILATSIWESETFWVALVGAILYGLGQWLQIYLSYRRAMATKKEIKKDVKTYSDETLRQCDEVKKMTLDQNKKLETIGQTVTELNQTVNPAPQ